MRKNFLTKYLWVFLLLGINPWSQLYALTVWAGGNQTADVINDDLNISNANTIGNAGGGDHHLYIENNGGVSPTMTVTITASASIQPNDTAGVDALCPFGSCDPDTKVALHFVATPGNTIFVNVFTPLVFSGNNQEFLVSFSGGGELVFAMETSTPGSVSFTDSLSPSDAGTYFLVAMDGSTVSFERFGAATINDTNVIVGPHSLMGFMGTDTSLASETASINFDPTSLPFLPGTINLIIEDTGAFTIQSYLNGNLGTEFGICDVDFSTLAGQRGIVSTLFSGLIGTSWSGLKIVNGNTVLPALRSNPWCLEDNDVCLQSGFILGPNGRLDVADQTYVDYISTTTNVSPTPAIPADVLADLAVNCISPLVNQVVKDRNPSAFFADGPASFCSNYDPNEQPIDFIGRPQIVMHGTSKIYFRSGVDCEGVVVNWTNVPYAVDPAHQFTDRQGYGSVVFDVEGLVDIIDADGTGNGKALNILSIHELDTGGSVLIEYPDTNFKLRDFIRDGNGDYIQYGKACFLINGRLNFFGVAGGNREFGLQHTDELHKIFEKNTIAQSEATYIGGETFRLCPAIAGARPAIVYYNARLWLNTSAAFTGVDTRVTNLFSVTDTPNASDIIFYSNGFCVDQGTGRSLILGTDVGALASDLGTIISRDAHDDVVQEFPFSEGAFIIETLLTRPNNVKVTEGLPFDQNELAAQYSVHSFFLAHASNKSIGTPDTVGINVCNENSPFALNGITILLVDGSFIAFETQGGILNQPDTSVETGQGGIFVDTNGLFCMVR